jgi:hypothetical protein
MAAPAAGGAGSAGGEEPVDITTLLDGLSDKQLATIREAFASFASDGNLLKTGAWTRGTGALL